MTDNGNITYLLQLAAAGERDACERLYNLVESRLREIAVLVVARQATADLDLSPTMLIDDVFLKLVGPNKSSWHPGDRKKFFAFAARMMHELVIQARRKQAAIKRGSQLNRVKGIDELADDSPGSSIENLQFLLDLEAALDRFERFAANDALAFRLRYFLDCNFEEMGELLGVSLSEARRCFERSKKWLQSELKLWPGGRESVPDSSSG